MMFPGPLLAGAAGLLFGTALGTPVAIVAATPARRWHSSSAATGRTTPSRRWPAGGRAIRAWIARRGFFAVLYARLAPAVPYNLVNYAAGLTPSRCAPFAAATAIGCAPRAFAYAALGGHLGDLGSPKALVAIGCSSRWRSAVRRVSVSVGRT